MFRCRTLWIGLACVGLLAPLSRARADAYDDIRAQLDEGRLKEALEAAQKLTSQNPADCKAWLLVGDVYRHLTQVTECVNAYKKGLEACPTDLALLRNLGWVYDETERYEESAKVLAQVWAQDKSDPEVGSRLGAACYRSGRCQDGRKAYEGLLAAFPDRNVDRLAYAQLLTRSCKDYPAAEVEFQKLLAADPKDAAVHCGLAYMLADAGRVEDAVKAAETGLSTVTENKGCLYAAWGRALEAGADSLMAKGDVTEAITLYNRAIEPLTQGISDPVFGDYCKIIMAGVKYKESPMEDLKP